MENKIKEKLDNLIASLQELSGEYLENPSLSRTTYIDRKNEILKNTLQEAYNLGKEEEKWISVKTRKPEVGQIVITYGKSIGFSKYLGEGKFERYLATDGEKVYMVAYSDVTHWQPLPLAPKE